MDTLSIRRAEQADAPSIARIYNHYVSNTVVTFEEEPLTGDEMGHRVDESRAASLPWLVATIGDAVIGYSYASKWKGRCAYRYSVETTVYLDRTQTSRGIGSKLYAELLSDVRAIGMHVAIGGIALPNPASIALHERLGFKHVGTFREVGFKKGRWVDVGYWQVQL